MRKKGVALFVAALMIAAMAFPAGANVNPFSDLRSDHWAYEAVIKLANAGLVEGYPDGTFGGDRTFTRYEMAMVFARILARFEALIEEKIAQGIDAKAEQLALEIEAVRKALSERIDENYDDLLARIRALELEMGDVKAILGLSESDGVEGVALRPIGVPAELTDEARAALAQQLMDDMLDQLRILLKEDIDDLARRVRDLERALLDERDVERIARQVIADALAAQAAEIEAAEADAVATAKLVESRVDDLEEAIADLALEFRGELAQLGVQVKVLEARVDRIEGRVDRQEEQIADLMSRIGSFSFSGKNKTEFKHTAIEGDPNIAYQDPRDEDSDKFERGVNFTNTFTLTMEATPAENVNVKASLEAVNEFDLDKDNTSGDNMSLKGNLTVTTPGVLRSLQVGDLNHEEISSPFSKYVLHKDTLDDETNDPRGAHVDLVWGMDDSTNLHGFLTRDSENGQLYGAHTSYRMSDAFNLSFAGVQRSSTAAAGAPVDSLDTVFSVGSEGVLENVDYSVFYSTYAGDASEGNVIEARASLPIAIATASFEYGSVDEGYQPAFAKELDSGKDMEFKGLDWLERYLTPAEDWLDQGESAMTATLSAPIFGIPVSASFGSLTTDNDETGTPISVTNNFVRAEVGKLSWAGIDASLLYDRRQDEDEDTDETIRATFGASILGADVEATIHNRKNEQVSWVPADEREQQHVWVTAKSQVNLLLPLTLEGRFGTSQTAVADQHIYAGVSVDELPVGPFTLSAGYSMSQNDVDAGKWWMNRKWSNDEVNTMTFGVGYVLREFFGTDVQTNYEYKMVYRNGAADGTARNTFSASFDKELRGGEARLSGEGRLVTGGSSDDKRTGTDVIAKLNLTYPVFAGGDLTIGGTYVSAADDPVKDDYSVFELKAGLEFGF